MAIELDPKARQLAKFKKIDESWRSEKLAESTNDALFKTIGELAMHLVQLELEKSLDEDLISLKEQAADAGKRYNEGKKDGMLKIEFLMEVLNSRGVDVPGLKDLLREEKVKARTALGSTK